jgi:transcriptional regulator with GAF, ATPase, and Fis domain
MGEHLNRGDPGLALIADVAIAATASNTRQMLTAKVGEALSRYLPVVRFELEWPEDSRVAKPERKSGSPSGQTVVIPLPDLDGPSGYARISLSMTPTEDLISRPLLETLGSVLAFAQRHCRVVERIAKLSSTAHHESQDLRKELLRYTEPDRIVARSESMRRVVESAELVAHHDTTVLLRGESGTGKELLARRIHRLSKRARQPFVTVNCGALPETLIESELFGHEKGAFTGAVGRYRGRFERANNGTIFLDEVAELPLSAQVKLLRILQEGEFERLGGEQTIRVNVRVLAATHRPLEAMMADGTFRADLYYRINVFPITIPPLRERVEDIPLLARELLAETSKRLGCSLPSLSTRGIAKLVACPWPGNVRDLANTLERELIVTQGRSLEFTELPASPVSAKAHIENDAEDLDDGVRRIIQSALKSCGGRIYGKQGAAARLGIPPSTLQGKMKRLRMTGKGV